MVASCCLAAGGLADEASPPPVAPLPEQAHAPISLEPASFDPDATSRSSAAGPLPLSSQPTTGGVSPPSARPLRDWTVLVAIGAAFAMLAAFRLRSLRRTRPLPPDVFELLGEGSLGGQHGVRVVRFGPRALLVAVSSTGCQTLAVLDDPQATERIVAACQGDRPAGHPRPRPAPGERVGRPRPPGREVA